MPTPICLSCFFSIGCVFLSIFQWSSHSCVTLMGNMEGDAVMALSGFRLPLHIHLHMPNGSK
ncbi:hypothetical protein C4D60_Mb05t14670 [Musa balbisiana]|uniref:Uncharacterized protein n=1 Tax=Musa balbisiana TaxID=52838 RepID=A0A4S8JW59_MUSBA|nr:hypothetical protein C4D60_Mb05t14670 [Musa balbisiana]